MTKSVAEPGLHGILVALSTPFDEKGGLDEQALRSHAEVMLDAGVHGIVTCGSTGEFAALSLAERRRVTEVVVDQVAGRIPVVAGTGSTRTSDAVELSAHAADAGAEAVLVVHPFYEAPTTAEIIEYYATVGQASHLPIVIYNLPSGTGVNLDPGLLATIADRVPTVQYVKDSSGSIDQAYEITYQLSEIVTPLIGWDTLLLPLMQAGAAGVIWGAPNFMPHECVRLWEHVQRGEAAQAEGLWRAVWPVMQFLGQEGYAASVKTAAGLLGYDLGAPRPPFSMLRDEPTERLRSLLDTADIRAPQPVNA